MRFEGSLVIFFMPLNDLAEYVRFSCPFRLKTEISIMQVFIWCVLPIACVYIKIESICYGRRLNDIK